MRSDFSDVHYLNVLYMCMKFTVSVLIDLYCQNLFYFISTKGNRRK